MTEVQELVARLRLRDEMSGPIRKVRAGISGVSDALNHPRMQRGISQIGTGIRNAALIGAAGIGILVTQVAAGLSSLVELEQQQAQTNAVIASTGGVAGITGQKVTELAEKYESLNATIGDETIRAGENMLLTFTNIREDAFEPALAAVLDMNTAMGKGPEGLTTTAILVGKALNDPIRGLTALRRVGVQFTEAQEKQIKALIETGDVMGAQKIVLAELNKEFGGSFLAQGDTTAGKVAKFRDSIEDLQRSLASALLPTIGKIADRLSTFLQDPATVRGIEELGRGIAGLFSDENLDEAAGIFKSVFSAARDAAPTIAAAAKITGEVVKTAVGLFRSLPPEIQKLAIGAFAINKITGGLVTNIAGGLIGSVLKQLVSGVVNVNGAVVNVNGGIGGKGGIPPVAGGGAAAGIGAAGLAGVAGVGVILIGGAAVSLNAIKEAAQRNNALAAQGLTQEEIVAQKYYTATRAYQETAFKQLHGKIPGREVFESGTAKLAGVITGSATRTKDDTVAAVNRNATLLNAAAGRSTAAQKAAIAAASSKQLAAIASAKAANQQSAFAIRDRVTSAGQQTKAAIDSARSSISSASRAAGREAAEATRRKRWQFNNYLTVNTSVSVKESIKTQTTFKKFGNIAL